MRRFLSAGALMTAVALAAAAAASAAVPSPSYQLGGVGFGSSFFGTGIGSNGDRGFWQATMTSDPATGAISSGTFSLRSNNGSVLSATVDGGSMSASSTAGCSRQQVSVSATLTSADGPLLFTGTVNQLRVLIRGTCTVLFSSVQGSLAPAPAPPPPPSDGSGDL